MNRIAGIFGIKGIKLTMQEISFIRKFKPWGIILFERNIKSLEQLKDLNLSIRKIMQDKYYPILVDQEGGRVSRLNKILDLHLFSQKHFGELYENRRDLYPIHYYIYIKHVSDLLNQVGININTVPVLDLLRNKSHKIIGTRSFSKNPKTIKKIGFDCIKNFSANKIGTVIKHIPGHGLAKVDSHFKIPVVKNSKSELIKKDFNIFKDFQTFFAMTAHVIYEKYDSNFTATHSKIIIEKVIRDKIGYKGVIISDDISMKSLSFGLINNATLALKAGCNLVLHCNCKIREMIKLSKTIPKIDDFVIKKTSQFYNFLR